MSQINYKVNFRSYVLPCVMKANGNIAIDTKSKPADGIDLNHLLNKGFLYHYNSNTCHFYPLSLLLIIKYLSPQKLLKCQNIFSFLSSSSLTLQQRKSEYKILRLMDIISGTFSISQTAIFVIPLPNQLLGKKNFQGNGIETRLENQYFHYQVQKPSKTRETPALLESNCKSDNCKEKKEISICVKIDWRSKKGKRVINGFNVSFKEKVTASRMNEEQQTRINVSYGKHYIENMT